VLGLLEAVWCASPQRSSTPHRQDTRLGHRLPPGLRPGAPPPALGSTAPENAPELDTCR
jgi:hypothetical protein